jgi:hypothetical protein
VPNPSSQERFKHLWRQTSLYGSRNKSQAPLSRHTATRQLDNLDRTPQPLTPLSVSSSSSPSPSTQNTLQPLSNNLRKGVMWRNAHIMVLPPPRAPTQLLEFLPRVRQSAISSSNSARDQVSLVFTTPAQRANSFVCQCGYWDSSVNPQSVLITM